MLINVEPRRDLSAQHVEIVSSHTRFFFGSALHRQRWLAITYHVIPYMNVNTIYNTRYVQFCSDKSRFGGVHQNSILRMPRLHDI